MQDLEYYAGGCRRSLADPAKARFHAKEQILLDAIMSEIHRQNGGDATPTGGQGQSESHAPDFGGPPPPEDVIPFAHCEGIR